MADDGKRKEEVVNRLTERFRKLLQERLPDEPGTLEEIERVTEEIGKEVKRDVESECVGIHGSIGDVLASLAEPSPSEPPPASRSTHPTTSHPAAAQSLPQAPLSVQPDPAPSCAVPAPVGSARPA